MFLKQYYYVIKAITAVLINNALSFKQLVTIIIIIIIIIIIENCLVKMVEHWPRTVFASQGFILIFLARKIILILLLTIYVSLIF